MKLQHATMYILMYRYIDDIFAIFHTTHSAKQYMTIFNGLRPGKIILKLTHLGNSVDILDLVVSKSERFNTTHILDINLFQKVMNTYLYLPMTSYHRRSTYTSFITAELKRYRINCSSDTHYNNIKTLFFERLITRGYPTDFLQPLFQVEYNRFDLLVKYNEMCFAKQTNEYNKRTNTPLTIKIPNTSRNSRLNLHKILKYDEYLSADINTTHVIEHNKTPMITLTKTQNIGSIITESRYKFVIDQNLSN
jgi:hypothetical protein